MGAYEKGQVTGTVNVLEGDYGPYLLVNTDTGREKRIYPGKQFQGPLPESGARVTIRFATAPPAQGRQYGSSYLDSWELWNGNGNGGGAPSNGDGAAVSPVATSEEALGLLSLLVAINAKAVGLDPSDELVAMAQTFRRLGEAVKL